MLQKPLSIDDYFEKPLDRYSLGELQELAEMIEDNYYDKPKRERKLYLREKWSELTKHYNKVAGSKIYTEQLK